MTSATPPSRDLAELQRRYGSGEVILFVGAGLPRAAGLPSWRGLVDGLLDYTRDYGIYPQQLAEIEGLVADGELIDALTEIEFALTPTGFGREVVRLLDDSDIEDPPPIYEAVAALAPKLRGVMTTNLDRLLERALGGGWTTHARPVANLAGQQRWIFKLHGTLPESDTWVLTRPQYDRATYADPLHQSLMQGLFWGGSRLLFIGYGLRDPDFEAIRGRLAALSKDQAPQHFVLIEQAQVTQARRRKLASAGLTLIPYANPDGSHAELLRILDGLAENSGLERRPGKKRSILFVSSNPSDTARLKLDRELKIIREAIDLSRHGDRLTLDAISAATIHELRRALLRKPYQIVHISGHGEPDGLMFEDLVGNREKIDPEGLAGLFANKAHPPGSIECVVFNACHSISTGEPTSKLVEWTVAMEGRLSDGGALEFSRGFYDALAAGRGVDEAFAEGVSCRNVAAPMGSFDARLLRRDKA